MARRGEMPKVLPEIHGVYIAVDGNIGLRRWPRAGKRETVFDVLSADGQLLRTVRLSADLLMDPVPWVSPKSWLVSLVILRLTHNALRYLVSQDVRIWSGL